MPIVRNTITPGYLTGAAGDHLTTSVVPRSGYSLPVYGLDNGQFYIIHVTALVCIFISLACAITTIVWSFRSHGRRFFQWSAGNRMAVYLAVCDGFFNLFHSMDHLHYAIQRGHVTPRTLCAYYGFNLAEFISAQNLLVFIIAINACVLVYRRHKLNFGRFDWRLMAFTFGVPFLGGIAVASLDGFGPHGAFCYFDGVKGSVMNIFFTTVPLLTIVTGNAIMYGLTLWKIRSEAQKNTRVLGSSQLTQSTVSAARTCLMFVTAFFCQWWAIATYGTWQLIYEPPQIMFQFVTTFTNLGGVFNFIVFLLIRRRSQNLRPGTCRDGETDRSQRQQGKQSAATICVPNIYQ